MFVSVTHIDALTEIVCTKAAMRTGPKLPFIKGFVYKWANESIWPIKSDASGVYLSTPLFFGTCDDDANLSVSGFQESYTEARYQELMKQEFLSRPHFPSWKFDEISLQWTPPVSYPQDGQRYHWDEQTVSWESIQIMAP